jgi:hypothetical protein
MGAPIYRSPYRLAIDLSAADGSAATGLGVSLQPGELACGCLYLAVESEISPRFRESARDTPPSR